MRQVLVQGATDYHATGHTTRGTGTVGTVAATCPVGVGRECDGARLLSCRMSPIVAWVHLQGLAQDRRKTLALEWWWRWRAKLGAILRADSCARVLLTREGSPQATT